MQRLGLLAAVSCGVLGLQAYEEDPWYHYEQRQRDYQENRNLTYWRERVGLVQSSVHDMRRDMPTMVGARINAPWEGRTQLEVRQTVDVWPQDAGFVAVANGATPDEDLARERISGFLRYTQNLGRRWMNLETVIRYDDFGLDAEDEEESIGALGNISFGVVIGGYRSRYHNNSIVFRVNAGSQFSDFLRSEENIAGGVGLGNGVSYRHNWRRGQWLVLLNVDADVTWQGEATIHGPGDLEQDYEYVGVFARAALGMSYRVARWGRVGVQADYNYSWYGSQELADVPTVVPVVDNATGQPVLDPDTGAPLTQVANQNVDIDEDVGTWVLPVRLWFEWNINAKHALQVGAGFYPVNDFDSDADGGADNVTWTFTYSGTF